MCVYIFIYVYLPTYLPTYAAAAVRAHMSIKNEKKQNEKKMHARVCVCIFERDNECARCSARTVVASSRVCVSVENFHFFFLLHILTYDSKNTHTHTHAQCLRKNNGSVFYA